MMDWREHEVFSRQYYALLTLLFTFPPLKNPDATDGRNRIRVKLTKCCWRTCNFKKKFYIYRM